MRKLLLQVQLSIDGYIAGPNGEMDWMTWNWDDQLKDFVTNLTDGIDTILLGRGMAGGFIGHWSNVVNNTPDDPSYPFAKTMVDAHKVVFTKTMESSEWDNTELAKGDITEEVNKLKNQDGKDIIVYGGAGFVSSLIKAGLIDEYYLFVNPAAIGKGLQIFAGLDSKLNLKLTKAQQFDCGIAALCYQPA
jgi:dihydrofolate reductase